MENTTNKPILGKFLRGFLELLLLLMLVAVFFWMDGEKIIENKVRQYVGSKNNLVETVKLPAPADPVKIVYQWEYNGQQYLIEENLFKSYYDFYAALPTTYSYYEGELAQNWEEEYFNMFLAHPNEDKTISELAIKIKELGAENDLSDDQIVELVLSFVQNIAYDEVKAKKILSKNDLNQLEDAENAPDYPYEVLYKKTGICSDKSLLAYSLMRELGYGVAIFVYDAENHMSIGIKCPEKYSTYGSGYCYAETTNPGNKIGLIPDLNTVNNTASSAKEIKLFGDNQDTSLDSKIIGEAKIISKTEGKIYSGIIKTIAIQQKITDLKIFLGKEKGVLSSMQVALSSDQNKIADLKNKMDKLLKKDDFSEYNNLVPKYNEKITDYKKRLDDYNSRVNSYNQKVTEYNSLIKSFYQT